MTSIIEITLIILLGATLMVAFQSRLKLPLELLMLIGSLLISFVPHLPRLAVVPELVFLLFLPPILFAAAYFTSWRDFKANRRPIALLAIGLVLFTSVSVALVARLLIPSIPWPIAFALGAMISPPDAAAASALTRKLGLPRRLITILEGESLVNDATALVIYRFAIAAAVTGVFSLSSAFLQFLWVGAGGIVTGYLLGRAGLWLIRKLEDVKAQTVTSLVTSFGAYIVGESIGVSGVISTVTAGLCFGRWLPMLISAQTRIGAKANWDLVLFVINGFVFTMIGLQLQVVMSHLDYSWKQLTVYAVAINITVILVRFLWVFPATYLPRWLFPSIAKADPSPPWQAVVVLGWLGMRGIVSLAAALALPETFPHRSLLVFLTYSVILVTLMVQPLTLPFLLRVLKLKGSDEHAREEALARYGTTKTVLNHLSEPTMVESFLSEQIEALRERYEQRLKTIEPNMSENAYSSVSLEDQRLRRLLQNVINWEREALQALRRAGKIHDEVFHGLSYELDLEELRLKTPRL